MRYKRIDPWEFDLHSLKVRIGRLKCRYRDLTKETTELYPIHHRLQRMESELKELLDYIEECEIAYEQMREVGIK